MSEHILGFKKKLKQKKTKEEQGELSDRYYKGKNGQQQQQISVWKFSLNLSNIWGMNGF